MTAVTEVNGHEAEAKPQTNGHTCVCKCKNDGTAENTTESKKEVKKPVDDTPVGSITTIHNIYKSAKDKDGNWTWVDKYPEDVAEAAENDETAKFALIVRNKKAQDSRKKLEADSIIIQSPWLRAALGEIFDDYPGISCALQRLVIEAPFKPFVHRWSELLAYMSKELDDITREHLNLLLDVLRVELKEEIKAFEDYVQHGIITYQHLWMIFQPGSAVLSESKGPLSAFELVDTEYMETQCGKFLRLRCEVVDWSGTHFGRGSQNIDVFAFSGTREIASLRAYPFHFHENPEAVRENLIKQGQRFEELSGYHFKAYSGTAITWDKENNEVPIQVSGRIVIDIDSFNRYSPYRGRFVSSFNAKDIEMLEEFEASRGDKEETNEAPKVRLTEYHQMLCHSRVRGYSLKLKKWLDFFTHSISEIVWNSTAFTSLVLPEEQKELVLAFSESQVDNRQLFDDVIQGKGKGIIMLLSGPPGVGKTLTAEAVAENMKVPLHTISSGDLGSTAWEVERGLSNILDLVARWNAILLLDECDVFLEARSAHDLQRNKIVSIFLRTLEYYEGILFMTTNRVDNIDAAFQSRIHVSMEYLDLTTESRKQIWKNFLNASKQPHDFSETDLEELGTVQLNGRQIKNILKTAQLLACRKKQELNRALVDIVLGIERRRPGPASA